MGPLGGVVVNEKDISFHKKPEALLLEVFESLRYLSPWFWFFKRFFICDLPY